MKPTTIKDIARRLDLSFTTVSRALNNDIKIKLSTRELVKKTAEEMNYFPNMAARGLVRRKSETIAFMSTRFAAPFISNVLDAFEQKAFYTGRYVHGIIPYSTRNEEAVKEMLLKRILRGRMADALVMLSQRPSEKILEEFNMAGVPVLLIENRMPGAHSITVDNAHGARSAAQYLVKTGRKRICLITGEIIQPPSRDINTAAVERKEAFVSEVLESGIFFNESNIETIHAYKYEEGMTALDNFIKKGIKPDAIFCAAGDIVAMGVLERAREKGISIPEDMAIIGYDDILSAKNLNPPLTTIRQPLHEIGEMAFEMILDAVDGKLKETKNVVIKPELIIRKSA